MKNVRIVKKIGVISNGKNVSKEINIVEWSEGCKVVDIRKWSDGDAHKGISLNLMEAEMLKIYLEEAITSMKAMVEGNVESIDIGQLGFKPISDDDLKNRR